MDRKRDYNILSVQLPVFSGKMDCVFTLESGQCVVLTGESGAGKSLLLKKIADLLPGEGQVLLNHQPCSSFLPSQWRKKVTYVAAETGWWESRIKAHVRDMAVVRRFMSRLNLNESLLEASVTQLSTGEKQRMGLLRALSPEVEFLLLDEITSALDPVAVQCVEALLVELKSFGIGILLVSHNMEQVSRLADRHYHLTRDDFQQLF